MKYFHTKRTPLHIAANQNDNLELATLLIHFGANVNIIDEDGQTELHYAVQHGRKNITKLLINSGAITNVMDKDGDTPLKIASQKRT